MLHNQAYGRLEIRFMTEVSGSSRLSHSLYHESKRNKTLKKNLDKGSKPTGHPQTPTTRRHTHEHKYGAKAEPAGTHVRRYQAAGTEKIPHTHTQAGKI